MSLRDYCRSYSCRHLDVPKNVCFLSKKSDASIMFTFSTDRFNGQRSVKACLMFKCFLRDESPSYRLDVMYWPNFCAFMFYVLQFCLICTLTNCCKTSYYRHGSSINENKEYVCLSLVSNVKSDSHIDIVLPTKSNKRAFI